MRLAPFADEETALRIGGLLAENRLDRVTLSGTLDLTRDKAGLDRARRLRALAEAVVQALEAEGESLPDRLPPPEEERTANPFG